MNDAKLNLAADIGDSYGLGRNKSKHHHDVLIDKVTLRAKGKVIARDGKYLI